MWMHLLSETAQLPNEDRITPENYEKKAAGNPISEMTRCLRGILDGPNLEPQKDAKIDVFLTQRKAVLQ